MFIYWLLLAFPALMALTYPPQAPRGWNNGTQTAARLSFLLFYVLVGSLRFEVGADWLPYDSIYRDIEGGGLLYGFERIDPLFGALNWVSSRIGTGIYLVNGVCCFLLGYGTLLVARQFREPWMAITIAVPYLLIVIGFGYVRQAAAIGLILIAIDSHVRQKRMRTLVCFGLAAGFHATSILVFPVVAGALIRRNPFLASLAGVLLAGLYYFVLAARLGLVQQNYENNDYESSGALVRLMMGLIPAVVILLRLRAFETNARARSIWLAFALANLGLLAAYSISTSTTAVDRIAQYFAVIQVVAYGEFRGLTEVPNQMVILARMALIALAVAVQGVWLIYATHSVYWVPYKSVLDFWL